MIKNILPENLSNALTPVYTQGIISAYKVYETLKRDYDIVVNPSGGDLKDKMFRVGHIGNLTIEDNNKLVIDPIASEVVKEIFDLYLKGYRVLKKLFFCYLYQLIMGDPSLTDFFIWALTSQGIHSPWKLRKSPSSSSLQFR